MKNGNNGESSPGGDARASRRAELLAFSVDAARDPMLWIDSRGRLFHVNDAAVAAYGWSREELLARTIHDLDEDFHPATWDQHWQHLKRAGSLTVTVRHVTASGEVLPLEIVDTYVAHPRKEFSIAVARDISQRESFDERMQLMQFSVDSMIDSAFWVDHERRILYANDAACRNLGYAYDELLAMRIEDLDPGFPLARWETSWQELKLHKRLVFESELRRSDGCVLPVEVNSNYIRCFGEELNCVFARDISERRLSEERLQHLATHDTLTGLPNRSLLNDRLHKAIQKQRREPGKLALLFMDLDQFKLVNDTFGHGIGDDLLVHVSRILRGVVRESDTVARLGGDEFVLLVDHLDIGERSERIASAIVDAFVERPVIDGVRLDVTPSIGIAVHPDDGPDAETLFKHADIAMYRAKELGGNRFQFFSPAIGERVNRRVALKGGLSQALERQELRLHYQPIVEIASGRLVAAEALLRWEHPEEGLLLPGRFIAVAEETGLIESIGAWAIHTACAQVREWLDAGLAAVPVAVNVSVQQLRHRALVEQVRDALDAARLEPRYLGLEVTESMMMEDPAAAVAILAEVRDHGLTLAIDDFGTGHSSLGYLKRFPVDLIKIDAGFVAGIDEDRDDATLVRTIIDMAHNLGFRVLAEGIERRSQRDFLAEHGCELAQGYLFDRPLPADRLRERLERNGR